MTAVHLSPFDGVSATECRRILEESGRRVRFFKGWPLIGRGGVRHDLLTHEEVERRMDAAMHTSPLLKLRWLMGGRKWW